MRICWAIWGFSSMLTLTIRTAPLLARTAPWGPEIHDDRRVERAVDDLGHEIGAGNVLYRGCRGTADQRFTRHYFSSPVLPTTWPHAGDKASAARETTGSPIRSRKIRALEQGPRARDPRDRRSAAHAPRQR